MSLTDRELLGLAAKAAGIEYWYQPGSHRFLIKAPLATMDGTYFTYWDPLTNDGDALRLAVKLKLTMQQNFSGVFCYDNPDFADKSQTMIEVYEQTTDDPYAAIRRAIVRAAAEIAHGIKEEQ